MKFFSRFVLFRTFLALWKRREEYRKRSYNTLAREEASERMCDETVSRQINKGGVRCFFVFFALRAVKNFLLPILLWDDSIIQVDHVH